MSRIKVQKDLTGQRFGRLVVIEQAEDFVSPSGNKVSGWLCKCDCGNEVCVRGASLLNGNTKSCGCYALSPESKNTKKYNTFIQDGEIGRGYDYKGSEFLFDWEDYDIVSKYCWSVNTIGYVRTQDYANRLDILMHRYVTNAPKGMYVDHINHNKSDNRKSNLRVCSQSENMMNAVMRKDNKTGVKGVRWLEKEHVWEVRLKVNGEHKIMQKFDNFDEAVAARKEAEIKYFGDYRYKGDDEVGA